VKRQIDSHGEPTIPQSIADGDRCPHCLISMEQVWAEDYPTHIEKCEGVSGKRFQAAAAELKAAMEEEVAWKKAHMKKDEWIQRAKALLFDCSFSVESIPMEVEIHKHITAGGGYNVKTERPSGPLQFYRRPEDVIE
jgi:hypothetical protein